MGDSTKIILVTGGSGLVGQGIKAAVEKSPKEDESFVYLSSKDADLTWDSILCRLQCQFVVLYVESCPEQ